MVRTGVLQGVFSLTAMRSLRIPGLVLLVNRFPHLVKPHVKKHFGANPPEIILAL